MKIFLSLLIATLLSLHGNAQSFKVSGRLTDTANSQQLPYASVVLIHAADSIMADFTRTTQEGTFSLKAPATGKYFLLATFPGFTDFVDVVNVSGSVTDVGTIPMITREHLLNEFVLKAKRGAIVVKGDTTEYMADSFYVKDGATVEDLLKKLPGLQVDKSGNITAQGESVQKVLVDGEEFFSDDPAVVTKNLQARAVESVQVFDKKSDQAELTGVDDGTREKTINLKLKEDSKRGYFGKAKAGVGTDKFYDNQLMVNAFKGKRKISLFGIHSNTGTSGLGWQDQDKYGGGNTSSFDGENFTITSISDDDDIGGWNGTIDRGLPKVLTGGLHYSNKWLENKHALSGNYRFADYNIFNQNRTLTQYLLPGDAGYTTTENSNSNKDQTRNRGDINYEWKPDTNNTIRFRANASVANTKSENFQDGYSIRTSGDTINNSRQLQTNETVTNSLNSSLFWIKKFSKKGRSLSVNLEQWYRTTDGDGLLQSTNNFAQTDTAGYTQTFDQRKDVNTKSLNLNGGINYTEPLAKLWFLELNYLGTVNNANTENLSYNKDVSGNYNALDSLFSSRFDYDVFSNSGGAGLRYVDKKWNVFGGGKVALAQWQQTDLLNNTTRDRNFTNYIANANVTYKPVAMTSVRFNYNGATQQPTINQIAPIVQNTDPLNISIGNPNLKQQFNHNFRINYNSYKVLSQTYKYLGANINFVDDNISRAENINSSGARTYQYINLDGNYNFNLYSGMGSKFSKLDLDWQLNFGGGTYRANSIINGLKNTSDNLNAYMSIRIGKDVDDKYDFSYEPRVSYSSTNATIATFENKFWTSTHELNASVELPGDIEFESDLTYEWRQKTAQFPNNNNFVYWNAAIIKKFLKSKDLHVSLSVNDILNQRRGISRYSSYNIITEDKYNTIQRYGLLSVVWNFRWNPKSAAPAENETQLMDIIK